MCTGLVQPVYHRTNFYHNHIRNLDSTDDYLNFELID